MIIQNNHIVAADILIVDDDQAILDALCAGLALSGITLNITTAHSADVGYNSALAQIPDVIVIDYNMPLGNGFELANKIRSRSEFKATKLLMLTAQNTHDKAWASIEHRIDAFIGKPFDIEDIEANIFSLLSQIYEKMPRHNPPVRSKNPKERKRF